MWFEQRGRWLAAAGVALALGVGMLIPQPSGACSVIGPCDAWVTEVLGTASVEQESGDALAEPPAFFALEAALEARITGEVEALELGDTRLFLVEGGAQ